MGTLSLTFVKHDLLFLVSYTEFFYHNDYSVLLYNHHLHGFVGDN